MKLDSTNRTDIKTETANLDISSEKSIFYGEKRLQRDSLLKRSFETKSFNFDRSQMENLRSNIDFVVDKDSNQESGAIIICTPKIARWIGKFFTKLQKLVIIKPKKQKQISPEELGLPGLQRIFHFKMGLINFRACLV